MGPHNQGCGVDPTFVDSDSDSDSDLTKSIPTRDRLRPISFGKHLVGQDKRPPRFIEAVQGLKHRRRGKNGQNGRSIHVDLIG